MQQLKELSEKLYLEFTQAVRSKALKKAILSRPRNKSEKKTVLTVFEGKNGTLSVKKETFMSDGKAIQKILSEEQAGALIRNEAAEQYKQINMLAEDLTLECIISDKGKFRVTGTLEGAKESKLSTSQDKEKSYIITPEQDAQFLSALGLLGKNGAIHDKKQAKFRQINKFLEQIEAVESFLPSGKLCICDLCCGKSYLTFAVYRYFTAKKGREVEMYGVDLKKDVIDYCSKVVCDLGYDGLHFICGDVSAFTPPTPPDMVLSLHACDKATDYVLAGAVKNKARVILSTPCCQHEFNSTMKSDSLSFLTEHSVIKQKLAAAATDALRAKMLQIHGYNVTVCEFIDPEETPKNTLLRCVRSGKRDVSALCREYESACELLGVTPTLLKLLGLPQAKTLPLTK